MKICTKCKIEYKDSYSYCPKCGKPYDANTKYAKIPGTINGDNVVIIKNIWNIFLYVNGCLIICAYLPTITKTTGESIFAILFGLSLLKIFYKLISDKCPMLDKKILKIARVALPIIILMIWTICFPTKVNNPAKTNANDSNVNTKKSEKINNEEDFKTTEPTDNSNLTTDDKKQSIQQKEPIEKKKNVETQKVYKINSSDYLNYIETFFKGIDMEFRYVVITSRYPYIQVRLEETKNYSDQELKQIIRDISEKVYNGLLQNKYKKGSFLSYNWEYININFYKINKTEIYKCIQINILELNDYDNFYDFYAKYE